MNYKEVPQRAVEHTEHMENVVDKKQWCEMTLEVEPIVNYKDGKIVEHFSGVGRIINLLCRRKKTF